MSLTYISAIISFLLAIGILNAEEAANLGTALPLLITTLLTLFGRYRVGDLTIYGTRK